MTRQRATGPGQQKIAIVSPAQPRKQPRQGRSLALVEALKSACCDLIESGDSRELTLAVISDHSGVAISSIYEYFPSIETLLAASFQELRKRRRGLIASDIRNLPPGATLEQAVRLAVERGLELLSNWRRMHPRIFIESAQFDELTRLQLVDSEFAIPNDVSTAIVERFKDEVRIRDPRKAVFLLHQTLISLVRAMFILEPQFLEESETRDHVVCSLCALLTASASTGDAPG